MKRLKIVWLSLLVCVMCTIPVSINSVLITPPGGTGLNELTATISVTGEGTIEVRWMRNYDGISQVQTENIVVTTESYTSTLTAPGGDTLTGYYWVDIYEATALLYHSDSVLCGYSLAEAPTIISFTAEPTQGDAPLYVNFEVLTTGLLDAPGHLEINFGDGNIDTSTAAGNRIMPFHGYDNPGTYIPTIKVSNPYGQDSTTLSEQIIVN